MATPRIEAVDLTGAAAVSRGAGYALELAIADAAGAPTDLTGAEIQAAIAAAPDPAAPLESGAELARFAVGIVDAEGGQAVLTLDPATTAAIAPGRHAWDVLIHWPDDQSWLRLPGGAIDVIDGPTGWLDP